MRKSTLALSLASITALRCLRGRPRCRLRGVTGPAIYVDGVLYRTVGTPTDYSQTGAPASSFETIYDLGAVAAERGGRSSREIPASRAGAGRCTRSPSSDYADAVAAYDANGSGDLDSAAEVEAAIQGGAATDEGVVKKFECPVIHVPQ